MAKLSDRLYSRGREFLEVEYPFICGAMTWVSEPNLVAEVSNQGGFGCLAGGNTPVDILEKQIDETGQLTEKPFGVNLITIAPAYQSQLDMVVKKGLKHIIFAGGFPSKGEIQKAKASGAKVMCFASTVSIARRMIKYGSDALILEGMEAGGHVGYVSLIVLLQQVLFEVDDVPIFVGGGLASGKMCAHMLLMGAAGVQLGTRFAMAEECCAHDKFKEKFVRANARDAISTPQYSNQLPVVAVRALKNSAMEDFGKLQLKLLGKLKSGEMKQKEAQYKVEEFWVGGLRKAVQDGDVEEGSLMAGQSVGLITKSESVKQIIEDLDINIEREAHKVKSKLL